MTGGNGVYGAPAVFLWGQTGRGFISPMTSTSRTGKGWLQARFYQRVAGQTIEVMDRRTLSRWYSQAFEMHRTAEMEADSERRQCRGLAEAWLNEHERPDKALDLFAPRIVKGLRYP